jgi:hypothetical protein
MDEQLLRLQRWAGRCPMPRSYTELSLRLAGEGYELELEGDTLTVYQPRRPAGLLGRFRRPVRQVVLQMVRHNGASRVIEDSADRAFVAHLLDQLRP